MKENLLPRFAQWKLPAFVLSLSLFGISVAAAPFDEAGRKYRFFQQPAAITVKGKVTGPQGPLEGVTVNVEGTSSFTTTNAAGEYTITAPERGTLIFSFAGFTEQRVPVARQAVHDVSLNVKPNDLQEVNRVIWVHVLALVNDVRVDGWMIQSVLVTATPVAEWQPSPTPAFTATP